MSLLGFGSDPRASGGATPRRVSLFPKGSHVVVSSTSRCGVVIDDGVIGWRRVRLLDGKPSNNNQGDGGAGDGAAARTGAEHRGVAFVDERPSNLEPSDRALEDAVTVVDAALPRALAAHTIQTKVRQYLAVQFTLRAHRARRLERDTARARRRSAAVGVAPTPSLLRESAGVGVAPTPSLLREVSRGRGRWNQLGEAENIGAHRDAERRSSRQLVTSLGGGLARYHSSSARALLGGGDAAPEDGDAMSLLPVKLPRRSSVAMGREQQRRLSCQTY